MEANDGATIIDPDALAANAGDPLGLGGSPTGTPGEVVGRGDGPTSAGPSRVAVQDIIDDYARRATDASQQQQLPPSQQELVGDYFDLLAN